MGGEVIATLAVILIVGGAVTYIIKAKRSGQRCIGCPDGKTCSSHGCSSNCQSCGGDCGGKTNLEEQ